MHYNMLEQCARQTPHQDQHTNFKQIEIKINRFIELFREHKTQMWRKDQYRRDAYQSEVNLLLDQDSSIAANAIIDQSN